MSLGSKEHPHVSRAILDQKRILKNEKVKNHLKNTKKSEKADFLKLQLHFRNSNSR